jgi:hypothetical protein
MAKINPLQQYFRQPKIFIDLPISKLYADPGSLQISDKIPVFGLTGMDEIILKTPDALLSGESIAKVINSCCPAITNPWGLANNDVDYVLTAIRIATYGNMLEVSDKCKNCNVENHYDIDLTKFIEHFKNTIFDSKIVLKDFIIKIKPLTFQEANSFSLENFNIQKKSQQVSSLENETERETILKQLFEDMTQLQHRIILQSVEQIELSDQVVTEKSFIKEYLDNCDRDVYEIIKKQFNINNDNWKTPNIPVKCSTCEYEDVLGVEINQTTFFGGA